jgi:hypothetical protein
MSAATDDPVIDLRRDCVGKADVAGERRACREQISGSRRHGAVAARVLDAPSSSTYVAAMITSGTHTLTCTMCMCQFTDQPVREGSGVRM